MFRLVVAGSLVACLASAQQLRSKDAKILKEQRFNAGDGRFGSAYAQEDGTISREETTADGERVGQYSYIDTEGKTITVKYTAGKDGFRIIEGDHVPTGATGLTSAAYDPEIAGQGLVAHVQEEAPARARAVGRTRRPAGRQQQAPRPRPAARRPAAPREAPRSQQQLPADSFQLRQQNERFQQPQQQQQRLQQQQQQTVNPFINPADPTHRDLKFNTNAAQFQPEQPARQAFQPEQFQQQPQQFQQQQQPQQFQQQQQQRQPEEPFSASEFLKNVPACAGCQDMRNFINPADPSHAELFQQQFRQPAQPARQAFQPAQQQQRFQQPQQQQQRFQQPQQQQQFFRHPAQQQQEIQPAFLQQNQRQQQQFQQPRHQFQQQQFQQPQQQFQQQQFQQPQQQFQQQRQQFQPQQFQQQQSAEELAHQRLGESQIQDAVRLQNCLANPSAGGC